MSSENECAYFKSSKYIHCPWITIIHKFEVTIFVNSKIAIILWILIKCDINNLCKQLRFKYLS